MLLGSPLSFPQLHLTVWPATSVLWVATMAWAADSLVANLRIWKIDYKAVSTRGLVAGVYFISILIPIIEQFLLLAQPVVRSFVVGWCHFILFQIKFKKLLPMKHFVIGLKRWKEKPPPNDYIIKALFVGRKRKIIFIVISPFEKQKK